MTHSKKTYKGDGTLERGKRIIAQLEKEGGVNTEPKLIGQSKAIYLINDYGVICCTDYSNFPEGYILAELPDEVDELAQLKKENEELRECLKLAQSEIYSIHSQYGDKLHAEEHSVFLTQVKQLMK